MKIINSCILGYGTQFGTKSWWPTFGVWAANAHTTYWTDFMEKKFQERLVDIASGRAQPLPTTEWRSWVRGSSSSRRIRKNIDAASDRFLRNVLATDSTTRRD